MFVYNPDDVEKNAFGACALWGSPRLSIELKLAELLGCILARGGIEIEMVEKTAKVDDDVERKGVEPDEAGARDGEEGEIGDGALVTNELLAGNEARVGGRWLHHDCDGRSAAGRGGRIWLGEGWTGWERPGKGEVRGENERGRGAMENVLYTKKGGLEGGLKEGWRG